jgi:RHS repeat-associated protein
LMESACSLKTCEDGGWLLESFSVNCCENTFTGKELDDSGLYYFGARYYDPALGTWLSPDPAMEGVNWYSYCGNNPMNYVDLWGLMPSINCSDAYAASHESPFWNPPPNTMVEPDPANNSARDNSGTNLVAKPKGNSIVIEPEDKTKDQANPENTGEQQKAPEDVTPDPYTTGPSERGVSTPERVNYVHNKWQIADKERNEPGSTKEDKNQHDDIAATTDWYCVYTTLFDAYSEMYALDKGRSPSFEGSKQARRNAVNNGVKENGYVYDPYAVVESLNKTFGTNYNYNNTTKKGNDVPNDHKTRTRDNGIDVAFVRFNHHGFAHTTLSIGNHQVYDVYHEQVEDLGGPIAPGVEGYDPAVHGDGCYVYGFHSFSY